MGFERYLKRKYRVEREWWIPPIALIFCIIVGIVNSSHIITSFYNDFEIIVLIFSLAFVAKGLSYSGIFRYIAYNIVIRSGGSTIKLIFYMFIFTSVVTLFTTNDIVILIITPILIEIAYQINIKNLLPLLLPQFIIANTISMGTLIGSPTNIIISLETNLNFLEYLQIMIIPTLLSFISIFTVFYFLTKLNTDNISVLPNFELKTNYKVPDKELKFNHTMRDWIIIFCILIILVTITTLYNLSLYWCSIPVIIISILYWSVSKNHNSIYKPVKKLPYGVFFFGMTFFIFAESFSNTMVFENLVNQFSNLSEKSSLTISIIGSGILVNIFNDIPASALIAQAISEIQFESTVLRKLTYQAILSGLNIGKYLTQIGALAGILWFSTINTEKKKHNKTHNHKEKIFPKRKDLLKYGLLNFFVNSLIIIIYLLIYYELSRFF